MFRFGSKTPQSSAKIELSDAARLAPYRQSLQTLFNTPNIRTRADVDTLSSCAQTGQHPKRSVVFSHRHPNVIFKIWEGQSLKQRLGGHVRRYAAREHRIQQKAFNQGFSACNSIGYALFYQQGLFIKGFQIQQKIPESMRCLSDACPIDPDYHARWLSALHCASFFHADLKPYHAYSAHLSDPLSLKWIDFGRCSFRLSQRKRIINLYQLMRFFLPDDIEAHQRCVERYCVYADYRPQRWRELYRAVAAFYASKKPYASRHPKDHIRTAFT